MFTRYISALILGILITNALFAQQLRLAETISVEQSVYSMTSLKEQKRLILGTGAYPDGKSSVHSIDAVKTLKRRQELSLASSVLCTSCSTDSQTFAIGCGDGSIHLYSTDTLKQLGTLAGHTDQVRGIAFSENDQMATSVSLDGTIRRWDLAKRKELSRLTSNCGCYFSISFSKNGDYFVVGGRKRVEVWITKSLSLHRVDQFHEDDVMSIRCLSNQERYLSGGDDSRLLSVGIIDGKIHKTYVGHKFRVLSLSISPNEKYMVSTSSLGTLYLWDADTAGLLQEVNAHDCFALGSVFLPDSNDSFFTCGLDQTVKKWNIIAP